MDNTALYKLSYGVFMLSTTADGVSNGCITNTCMQVANTPTRRAIACINTKDGKKLFVLYTDKKCLDEAEKTENNATPEMFRDNFAQVSIDEIGSMMAMPGPNGETHPSDGVILNPFHESLIVGRDMAIGFFNRKLQFMKEQAEKAKQEQEDGGKVIQFPVRPTQG